ncbi:MAG TPA: NYN domain-containing protein [Phormidium sp.]
MDLSCMDMGHRTVHQQTVQQQTVHQQIGLLFYEWVVTVQKQRSQFLAEKYRTIDWEKAETKAQFIEGFSRELSKAVDSVDLQAKTQFLLNRIFTPDFSSSPLVADLGDRCNQLIHSISPTNNQQFDNQINSSIQLSSPSTQRNTILLLDAENLWLQPEEEQFLQKVCAYPIQIKIAFANWRHSGTAKRDVELHSRGYQMIHVPPGKNSADMKMTAIGSSLFLHYPTAKEVIVCSSDGDLTHLCNTLKVHGLIVYAVQKQGDRVKIKNLETEQTKEFSAKLAAQIPSVEESIPLLKKIIQQEQLSEQKQWIRLSSISKKLKEEHHFSLNDLVNTHAPGKRARDIFLDRPTVFVTHQISEQDAIYVSLFEAEPVSSQPETVVNPTASIAPALSEPQAQKTPTNLKIQTKAELEQALTKALKELTNKTSTKTAHVTTLQCQFEKAYGLKVKQVLEQLNINKKYVAFLKECKKFKLQQTAKGWEISL